MPETPPPPTSDPTPHRRLFLGRLAAAVRRQDWAAVVVEVLVVVLGVVIGFQVTAWGQGRADRATEQTYLRQLAADLRETERDLARVDSLMAEAERSSISLAVALRLATPPSRDSLVFWSSQLISQQMPNPVTGTAEALVATGDLGLIRDDGLRSAISDYLETVAYRQYINRVIFEEHEKAETELMSRLDWIEAVLAHPSFGVQAESLLQTVTGHGADDLVYRLALDAEFLMSDRGAVSAATELMEQNIALQIQRGVLRSYAAALRAQVEAEIER